MSSCWAWRGGIPVARPVADALAAPLDVAVAHKLGVPGIEEVALGAIAEGTSEVVGDAVGWYLGVPPRVVAQIAARERAEVERRSRLYRAGRALPDLRGRTVVLVDDGLATGATRYLSDSAYSIIIDIVQLIARGTDGGFEDVRERPPGRAPETGRQMGSEEHGHGSAQAGARQGVPRG